MSQIISPCKGCTERYPGCHDHCEKYDTWKAEIKKQKDAEKEYKLSRREDWMRSEERSYGNERFARYKNKMRSGNFHGR